MSRRDKDKPFVETIGKTEPVSGMKDVTEPLRGRPINSFGSINHVPPTTGVNTAQRGGGLIDITPSGTINDIEQYKDTEPVNLFVTPTGEAVRPVVGWLVCIKGPNIGKDYRIHSDYNYVGSASGDIVISGDSKISRERHMLVTYDPEERSFYISPAFGSNIIRLNNKTLAGGAEQLKNYDVIRTGDSSFMFIGFCGEKFGWDDQTKE